MAVPLKGKFVFCDHDKVLYGLKIRFQLQRNDNENRLLFGVASAFGDQNKFVIDEMSWYIREYTLDLKTEEMLNGRLNSRKPLNVSYLKRRCQHVKLNQTTYMWNLGVLDPAKAGKMAFKCLCVCVIQWVLNVFFWRIFKLLSHSSSGN